jgi:hypothetical protein
MILESSKESGGKLLTEDYKKELFKSIWNIQSLFRNLLTHT